LIGLIVLLIFATNAAAVQVTLHTSDGVTLSASWLAPPTPAPAVLLVHSLSRTHADWDAVAARLNTAGLGVLALDLRGHGASGGTYSIGMFQPLVTDVQAGLAWLKSRPEVMVARLGIAGLNLGATVAVIAAAGDSAVKSVALLSPAVEFRGLRCDAAMRTFAARSGAAFLAAGALDPYGARSAKQLAAVTPGLRELRLVDNTAANGRALLADPADIGGAVVDWFRKTLL
jgi:alpha-beta hydrolase superfamily lysophospholipase